VSSRKVLKTKKKIRNTRNIKIKNDFVKCYNNIKKNKNIELNGVELYY
jgi:hypothetical protein